MKRVDRLVLLLALGLAACDSTGRPDDTGTETATMLSDQTVAAALIAHVEIPVIDMERAIAFYQPVFGVTLERVEIDGYDMALFPDPGGAGASAALAKGDVYRPSTDGAILYFRVADIDGLLARAVSRGGAVLYPKKDIGELGFVAEIRDSEGNRIALSQSRG